MPRSGYAEGDTSKAIDIHMGLDDATHDDLKLLKKFWAGARPIISWSAVYDMLPASWQEGQ